ncbi:hypothetical protein [Ruegeria sp. HKCCD6119]|uniref:hypothetical protein n=1 Tax=Ruegeria sp. HKCCD6119 TaxID=2683003 RepID=UPI001492690F|nr:hypothetical protein [Ruegeria sp. HKCCD6119]NOD83811.1 hypothetical protein [Ruegeria sp. HKCCD6119]
MNSITQPLELQAAALRMAGYAIVNQIKIAQIMTRSALELPMVSVHALHLAASAPGPVVETPAAKPVAKAAATRKKRVPAKSPTTKNKLARKPAPTKPVTKPAAKPVEFSASPRPTAAAKPTPAVSDEIAVKPVERSATPAAETVLPVTPKPAPAKPAPVQAAQVKPAPADPAPAKVQAKPAPATEPRKPQARKTRAPSKPPVMPEADVKN